MQGQPDLPGLESIDVTFGNDRLYQDQLLLWLTAFIVVLLVSSVGILPFSVARVLTILTSVGLILAALNVTSIFGSFHLRTDTQGLHRTALRGRWSIRWSDVIDAETPVSGSPAAFAILQTPYRRVVLPNIPGEHPQFEASVWQHLRRVGKADHLDLSEEARSLWYRVPGEIPEDVDWSPGLALSIDHFEATRKHIAEYHSAEGRRGMFVARPIVIPWSDIAQAEWKYEDTLRTRFSLLVESTQDSDIRIPFDPSDHRCAEFLLAVIRRLRDREDVPPIEIPPLIIGLYESSLDSE